MLRLLGMSPVVTREATDLSTWEQWLHLAAVDVQGRERQALADDPTPEELEALAVERDKLASAGSASRITSVAVVASSKSTVVVSAPGPGRP